MTKDEKPTTLERLKAQLAEHGPIAVWVYFGLFFIVLVSFVAAIRLGWAVESAAGSAGVWAGAYVATKLTQPLRIAATLVLTPLVTVIVRRFRR